VIKNFSPIENQRSIELEDGETAVGAAYGIEPERGKERGRKKRNEGGLIEKPMNLDILPKGPLA
jgi:hypothetical protein